MSTTRRNAIALSVILGMAICATPGGAEATLLTMVRVVGGTFEMGRADGRPNEQPVHTVEVATFLMSAHEVTQRQWREIMRTTPTADRGSGDNLPVYNVTWYDAVEFCNALSRAEGRSPCYGGSGTAITFDFAANGYRLPTEAEWEYAARGGASSRGYPYAGSSNADDVGWHNGNSQGAAHEVGLKTANELGVFDMSGNVSEWCWDWYDAGYYSQSGGTNPRGPASGSYRVLRGGGWGINTNGLRLTSRSIGTHRSDSNTGFRVVRPE